MQPSEKNAHRELASSGRINRSVYNLTGVFGLTTGIGVIAWGVWSLIAIIATFFYEESGLSSEQILINNALNQGLLLSAVVIALGVIVLELKKIQDLMLDDVNQQASENSDEPAIRPRKSETMT